MSRVFLLEQTHKDIRKAERFGRICYLFEQDEPRPSIFETDKYMEAITSRLETANFNPDEDLLLAVGQSIPLNLAFYVLATTYPTLRVLFFQARVQEYVIRTLIGLHYDQHYSGQ